MSLRDRWSARAQRAGGVIVMLVVFPLYILIESAGYLIAGYIAFFTTWPMFIRIGAGVCALPLLWILPLSLLLSVGAVAEAASLRTRPREPKFPAENGDSSSRLPIIDNDADDEDGECADDDLDDEEYLDDEEDPSLHDAIALLESVGPSGEDAKSLEDAINRLIEVTDKLDTARVAALKRETAASTLLRGEQEK